MMKKYIVLIGALILVGCDSTHYYVTTPKMMHKGEVECTNHGGLKYVQSAHRFANLEGREANPDILLEVFCKDSTVVITPINLKE